MWFTLYERNDDEYQHPLLEDLILEAAEAANL